jgi:amino acid adenylation domain-containing protein
MEMTNVQDIYPLSPMQQGMLFHTVYAGGSGIYFTQLSGDLEGTARVEIFRQAIERTLERHAILRTAFLWENLDEPLQVVRGVVELPVDRVDWRQLEPSCVQARFQTLLSEDRQRGFDLAEAPLMRLTLVRTGEEQYRFVWSHHHILLDGWSLSLILREILDDCEAHDHGRQTCSEPERPYRDYIAWIGRQSNTQAEGYWRKALAGFREPSKIGGRPRAVADAHDCGIVSRSLDANVSARLTAIGRRSMLTLNTIVQAAWALVLGRNSGLRDVVFGSVVSGRPAHLPGVESMVGLFINVMPVRETISDDLVFLHWLEQIQARQLESRRWESTPLIDIQRWSEVPNGTALFDSIVVFENYPAISGDAGARWNVKNIAYFEKANYPVTVIARPGTELAITINYNPSSIDRSLASRLLSQLEVVLQQVAQNPEARIGDVRLMNDAESHRITQQWNKSAREYPSESGIPELFERQANEAGDRIAVRYGEHALSYSALDRRANQLARFLRHHGVRTGQLVALAMDRSPEFIVSVLAILKAGAAYVPLDPGYPTDRLEFMLADTEARVLLTVSELRDHLPPFTGKTFCLDLCDAGIAEMDDDRLNLALSGGDLAYVMYTSGSTGRPKGIGIPHRAVSRLVINTDYVRLDSCDRVAQTSNICFDAATFEIWGALLSGACLVGIDKEVALSPRDFASRLREEGITAVFLTTALFNRLVNDVPAVFAGVRHVMFGGEAADPQSVRRALGTGRPQRLLHVYGPTESTTFATWHEVKEVADDAPTVPIGRPIANTRTYVLDTALEPVPIGVAGELFIGGDGLAHGYVARPDLTSEKFVPDPFSGRPGDRLYRTGDLVRYGEDGAIEFLGRNDDQVKIRGFRIEPGEIEALLRLHPSVRECAVMVRGDGTGEKRLAAYFAADPSIPPDELRAYLRGKVPDYMLPSAWISMLELPLNSNGKVDRKALPEPDAACAGQQQAYRAPRGPVERVVADVYAEILRVERVGIGDNFFDLGGHSLKATQLISRLQEVFQIDLPLRTIFEQPVLEQFCEALLAAPATREQIELTAEFLLSTAALSDIEADRYVQAEQFSAAGAD